MFWRVSTTAVDRRDVEAHGRSGIKAPKDYLIYACKECMLRDAIGQLTECLCSRPNQSVHRVCKLHDLPGQFVDPRPRGPTGHSME